MVLLLMRFKFTGIDIRIGDGYVFPPQPFPLFSPFFLFFTGLTLLQSLRNPIQALRFLPHDERKSAGRAFWGVSWLSSMTAPKRWNLPSHRSKSSSGRGPLYGWAAVRR